MSKDALDELKWHLEQRTQEYVNQGLPLDEARAAARKKFGNFTLLEEQTMGSDSFVWLGGIKRDIALAFRMLRRTPAVTAVAIASLALGIGPNTVVFTLMKHVVLDYLPVPQPERLVFLHNIGPEVGHTHDDGMRSSFSYPLYRDLNAATLQAFEGILAIRRVDASVSSGETTETVRTDLVSGNFFDVLKVNPWRGRLITPADARSPGASPIAVLGYGLWKRSFGADPTVVNRTVLVNKHPYVVVGVSPPQFYGLDVSSRADLFVPMSMKADILPDGYDLTDRLNHWCSLIARLRPGVTSAQASAVINAVYPPLRDQDLLFIKGGTTAFKHRYAAKKIELSPGAKGYTDLREQLSDPLKILLIMTGVVLLITIVNIANLLVARAVARQREMAIRLSVGAAKPALARQLMIESLALALLGGGAGIALAYGLTPVLVALLRTDLSAASISMQPDGRALLLSAAVTIVAGIAFGLLPAWQSTRTDVAPALKGDRIASHWGTGVWLRRGLVAAQVALSLVLVSAAILFTRSLQNLRHVNVGLNTADLVKFEVNPLQAGYSVPGIKTLGEELRERLSSIPGVKSAAVATVPILEDSDQGGRVTVEGDPGPSNESDDRNHYLRNLVSAGYLSTMQIRLIAGREFNASDSVAAAKTAIVNETFVQRFLAGRNPIGAHFGFGSGRVALDHTIVGVAADSRHNSISAPIQPFVYLPYLASDRLSSLVLYVRLRPGEQRAVMPEIRSVVQRLDADLPVNRLTSVADIVDESLFAARSLGYLAIAFAFIATALVIVGLYGVMRYSVARRVRELAIRMALGANPRHVLGMVLRETALLGAVGILSAIPIVLWAGQYIRSTLYGVQAYDPFVWFVAAALLMIVALLAGFGPAWGASRIDPHAVLKGD